jgi:hypothetical protein
MKKSLQKRLGYHAGGYSREEAMFRTEKCNEMRLQLSPTIDEVSWLELRLGERGRHGMVRTSYPSEGTIHKRLHALNRKADTIEWVYKVTFGDKG